MFDLQVKQVFERQIRGGIMERRDVLKGAGALAGLFASGKALGFAHGRNNEENTLAECAAECIVVAESCISFCLAQASSGSSDELACVQACREVIASCRALITLVSTNSPHLKAFAAVCADICRSCIEQCGKSSDEACQRCVTCCEECVALCEQV